MDNAQHSNIAHVGMGILKCRSNFNVQTQNCTLETMTDSARVNVQLLSLEAVAHVFDRTSIMGKETNLSSCGCQKQH